MCAIQVAGTDESGGLVVIPRSWGEEGVRSTHHAIYGVDLAGEGPRSFEVRIGDSREWMLRLLTVVDLQCVIAVASTWELEPPLANQRIDAGEGKESRLWVPAIFLDRGVETVAGEVGDGCTVINGVIDVGPTVRGQRCLNGGGSCVLVEIASVTDVIGVDRLHDVVGDRVEIVKNIKTEPRQNSRWRPILI